MTISGFKVGNMCGQHPINEEGEHAMRERPCDKQLLVTK